MIAERGLPMPSQQEDTAVVSLQGTREAINSHEVAYRTGENRLDEPPNAHQGAKTDVSAFATKLGR
jgi:hypothetical protein